MTNAEWLNKVERHKGLLIHFLEAWHPNIERNPINELENRVKNNLRITAPGAEGACQIIREQIKQTRPERKIIDEFETALANKDINIITNILNEAWFGVPESTSCWNITGFREAVELLEDPPESEEPEL